MKYLVMPPLTPDLVLGLAGQDPADARVVGLSYDGELGLAIIVTNDTREDRIDCLGFRWIESQGWVIDEPGGDHRSGYTEVFGQFPDHEGSVLRAVVQGQEITVPISRTGWYGLVRAVVADGGDPTTRVTFPDYE